MDNRNHSFTLGVTLFTGKSFTVVVQATDTILALKQRVFGREGLPSTQQNLLIMGRLLQPDTRRLQDFAIKAGDMIFVTLAGMRLTGAKSGSGFLLPASSPGSAAASASSSAAASAAASASSSAVASASSSAVASASSSAVASASSSAAASASSSAVASASSSAVVSASSSAAPSTGPTASAATPSPDRKATGPATAKDAKSREDLDSGSESDSDSNDQSMPGTDVGKLRASTIQHYANVTTVLRRPHADAAADPASTSRWPRQSQAYCVYTRKVGEKELTGIVTFGLSNSYQDTFFFAIGIGIEILLECPTPQARLARSNPNGQVTGATISDGWMFAVVREIAHQCFALGLQMRQLLEKLQLLSVEIGGVTLPPEYIDPETNRCCVLLGHLGDPDVPRGFNITVPHQHQWILQSVLFIPARVLTFAQCQAIRKDGAEARKKIAEEFVKNKSYSVCDIPLESWPKVSQSTTSTKTDESKSTTTSPAQENSSATSSVTSAPAHASSSAASSAPVGASPSAASSESSAPAHASSSAASSAPVHVSLFASKSEAKSQANSTPAVLTVGATSSASSSQAAGATSSASLRK